MLQTAVFPDDDNPIDTEFIEVDFECERTETDLILRKYRGADNRVIIPRSITKIGPTAFGECDFVESVEIPNSIYSIGELAFENCTSLNDIVIPDSVQEINNGAFYHCTSLQKMIIPKSIRKISDSLFEGCTALIDVEIPNSIKIIGQEAFSYCSSLVNLIIPNSVKAIGEGAFSNCSSLVRITLPESLKQLNVGLFSGCTSLKEIMIPQSVSRIGDSTFSDCTSLITIAIPQSVIRIGYAAFRGCTSLITANIPETTVHIDASAFEDCVSLNPVVFSGPMKFIGQGAFLGCAKFSTLRIPYYHPKDYPDYKFPVNAYKNTNILTYPDPKNSSQLWELPIACGFELNGKNINQVVSSFDRNFMDYAVADRPHVAFFIIRSGLKLNDEKLKKYLSYSKSKQNLKAIIMDLLDREGPDSLRLLMEHQLLTKHNIDLVIEKARSIKDVELTTVLLDMKSSMEKSRKTEKFSL